MNTPSTPDTPGQTTDMPCPVCSGPLQTCRTSSHRSFPWCPECGWNLRGASRALRAANLEHFTGTLPWLLVLLPVAQATRPLGPLLAYLADGTVLVALFIPALMRSQAHLDLARRLERLSPRRAHVTPPAVMLQDLPEAPRVPVLAGTLEPVRWPIRLLRMLGGTLFATGLIVFTPLSTWLSPGLRGGALLVMLGALFPFLGCLAAFLVAIARHHRLTRSGLGRTGEVMAHTSLLRREGASTWTLVSHFHYRFKDPDERILEGKARTEGVAHWTGARITIWQDPHRFSDHLPANACLYRTGDEGHNAG